MCQSGMLLLTPHVHMVSIVSNIKGSGADRHDSCRLTLCEPGFIGLDHSLAFLGICLNLLTFFSSPTTTWHCKVIMKLLGTSEYGLIQVTAISKVKSNKTGDSVDNVSKEIPKMLNG